jgi:hypothetical protein
VAVERVLSYCGLTYPAATGSATLRGVPGPVLVTPLRPLVAVTAVAIDGTELDADGYRWHRSGRLYRASGWGDDVTTVTVSATWGSDTLPPDVASVVSSAAARLAANPVGLRTVQRGEGDATAFAPDGFTLPELAMLHRWRVRCSA